MDLLCILRNLLKFRLKIIFTWFGIRNFLLEQFSVWESFLLSSIYYALVLLNNSSSAVLFLLISVILFNLGRNILTMRFFSKILRFIVFLFLNFFLLNQFLNCVALVRMVGSVACVCCLLPWPSLLFNFHLHNLLMRLKELSLGSTGGIWLKACIWLGLF